MTTIDVCSTSEIERLGPCWDDLAGRALEPNPFAERAFLIPALRHLSRRKLVVLCVWNGPDLARLDAIAVLRASVVPFGVVDVWRGEQAPYAALLLDRESAAPAVEAISCWLARQWPGAVGLGIADVDVNGALAETLRMLAASGGFGSTFPVPGGAPLSPAAQGRISSARSPPGGGRNGRG